MVQGKGKAHAKAQKLKALGEFEELHGGQGVRTVGRAGKGHWPGRPGRQEPTTTPTPGSHVPTLSSTCPMCKTGTLPPTYRVSGNMT